MQKIQKSHLRLKSSRLMKSLFIGNFKAAFSGKGIEFQDFREYEYGDDARYIDWLTSSREGNTVIRRYKEEKQADILCIFDRSISLDFEKESPKLQLAHDILSLLGEVSLQSGEAFGGYVLYSDHISYIAPKKNPSALLHILSDSGIPRENTKGGDVNFLLRQTMKRSLVFILSDSVEYDEKSFKMAAMKHDIVYIHLASHFENTLEGKGISVLRNGIKNFGVDLDNHEKQKQYQDLRSKQLQDLKRSLKKIRIDSIFLDENTSLLPAFLKLMKERERSKF